MFTRYKNVIIIIIITNLFFRLEPLGLCLEGGHDVIHLGFLRRDLLLQGGLLLLQVCNLLLAVSRHCMETFQLSRGKQIRFYLI